MAVLQGVPASCFRLSNVQQPPGKLTLLQQAQLFMAGLVDHIDVELWYPQDLHLAMSMARAYEEAPNTTSCHQSTNQ